MKRLITLLLTLSVMLTLFSFSVTADNEISIGTELEFTEHYFSGNLNGNTQNIYLIRRSEELQTFIELCAETNEFVSFASQLSEDYFSNKALVIVYAVSSMNCEYDITSVDVISDGFGISTVTLRYDHIEGADDSVQGHLLVAEVDASDVKDVEISRHIASDRYDTEIPFEDNVFAGFSGVEKENNSAIYIESKGQLDEFYAELENANALTEEFDAYLSAIDEGFFETKSLIAIYICNSDSPYYYDVTNVFADERGIVIKSVYDNYFVQPVLQYTHIMIEVNKSDVASAENIDVYYSSIENASNPPYTPPSTVLGDVNGDYQASALDYFFLKAIILSGSDDTYAESFGDYVPRADINGDGKLTAVDYLMLKRMIFTGTTN